jgi:hypothetical protein
MHNTSRVQVTDDSFIHPAGGQSLSYLPRPACAAQHTHHRKSWMSIIILTAAFTMFAWAAPVAAQQEPTPTPTPNTEDISSMPQLSDFTPPYTCPWFIGRPASCNIPIKVSLECIDIRTIPANRLSRPFTEEAIRNNDQACKLLPLWMDQDPRIVVTDKENSKLHIKYKFIMGNGSFAGLRVYTENKNFQVIKGIGQDLKDKSSYFVQKSLFELEERGYLP